MQSIVSNTLPLLVEGHTYQIEKDVLTMEEHFNKADKIIEDIQSLIDKMKEISIEIEDVNNKLSSRIK